MATAEKKDIVKKRLQELRNMCRDHYAVVAEESTMPDPLMFVKRMQSCRS